jgi:hypothetical protein
MTASNRRPLYSESADDGITGRPQRRRGGAGGRRARDGPDAADAALPTAAPADPSTASAYASALRGGAAGSDDALYPEQQPQQQNGQSEDDEKTRLLRQQMLLLPTGDQPCALKAAGSAAATAVLGYALGVIPATFRRQWGFIHFEGLKSARHLALVSGTYALVHCLVSRVRLADDGWSRGAAGCATGLAMGWQAGPASAAQSCAGIGLLSYVLDFGQSAAGGGGDEGETGGGQGQQHPRPLTQGVAHAAELKRGADGGDEVDLERRRRSSSAEQRHYDHDDDDDRGLVGALIAAAAAAGAALTAAAQRRQQQQRQREDSAWPSLLAPGGLPVPTQLAIGLLGSGTCPFGACALLGGGGEGGAAAQAASASGRRRVEW